ncbi:hypothetical protein PXD56_13000 [Maribacter sp. SA7]|nr:hypothetical protein [Maribacter zhoushanensis]MDF4203884.1 hypothetical protein [Maribacter zhoushanensis]
MTRVSPQQRFIAGNVNMGIWTSNSLKSLNQYRKKTGVQYNIEVSMKDSSDNNIKIPFNELSKTGSVVNVYNALVLAESLSTNSTN